MSETEHQKLTRRQFLKFAGGMTAGAIAETFVISRGLSRSVALSGLEEEKREYVIYRSEGSIPYIYNKDGEPFSSRLDLDAAELKLARQTMPELKAISLPPRSFKEAEIIQRIREKESNWPRVNGIKARTFEIVISRSVLEKLTTEEKKFGGSVDPYLRAHIAELNRILGTPPESIERRALLSRVMVVEDDVVKTWKVVNNKKHSWWANDEMNGLVGDIPYDIDSRWVLNKQWVDHVLEWAKDGKNPESGQLIKMDYALIHEWLHHFGMGDLYHYNVFRFEVVQSDGSLFRFNKNIINENDAMTSPSSPNLSSLSSMAQRFFLERNPRFRRCPQTWEFILSTTPFIEAYSKAPEKTILTVDYGELRGKVNDCYLAHPVDTENPDIKRLQVSTDFKAKHTEDRSEVIFSGENYLDKLWPVFYLVLNLPYSSLGVEGSGNILFPIPFQRVLISALVWGGASKEGKLDAVLTSETSRILRDLAMHTKVHRRGDLVEIGDPYLPGKEYHILVDWPPDDSRIKKEGIFLTASLPGTVSKAILALKL